MSVCEKQPHRFLLSSMIVKQGWCYEFALFQVVPYEPTPRSAGQGSNVLVFTIIDDSKSRIAFKRTYHACCPPP